MQKQIKFAFQLYAFEQLSCCPRLSQNRCSACVDIDPVEQRLQDAVEALSRALEERDRLKKRLNAAHDPFNRLPQELVYNIFTFCIPLQPTHRELFLDVKMECAKPFQLTLGAVCSAWRNFLWSSPLFWTSFSLDVRSGRKSTTLAEIAEEWIGRSASLPLHFDLSCSISASKLDPRPLERNLSALIRILERVIDRCSVVRLRIPSSHFSRIRIPSSNLPLKTLVLEPTSISGVKHKGRFKLNGNHAPSHLRITSFRLANVSISWNALTHLYAINMNTHECLQMLAQATSLVHCYFVVDDSVDFDHDVNSTASLHLPALRTLQLYENSDRVLAALTCPGLKSFRWEVSDHILQSPVAFITRSQCRIRRLYLDAVGISIQDDLIALLALLPSIKLLSVGNAVGESFFRYVGETAYYTEASNTSTGFLPNLVKFLYVGELNFPWSSISAMVPLEPPSGLHTSRRPLDHLAFTFSESAEDEEDVDYQPVIPLDDLRNFVDLQNEVTLIIQASGVDLMEFSADIHNMVIKRV